MSTIQTTNFLLPQTVINNGLTTGNSFEDPNNILLTDTDTADSQSSGSSDIIVGNFNFNVPQGAVVTGIEMRFIAKRGANTSPVASFTPYFVDNTSGENVYYSYGSPYTGLTQTLANHDLGGSTFLFYSSFTVDQINNMKLQIVSDGEIFVDSVLVKIYYYIPSEGSGETPATEACEDCNSQIQTTFHTLALPMTTTDNKMYLKSFNYADGTPVNVEDTGSCGGYVDFTIDEGIEKGNGNQFMENVRAYYWQSLSNGTVEVDLGQGISYNTLVSVFQREETITGGTSGATGVVRYDNDTDEMIVTQVVGTFQNGETITGGTSGATAVISSIDLLANRGLGFSEPYTSDTDLISAHGANAKVVLSNSAPFLDRFLKKCHVNVLVSAPINVEQEGVDTVNPVHTLNFKGGVSVVENPSDPYQADITITGGGTTPPEVVDTTSSSSGDTQVDSITLPDLNVQGVNRGVVVQISTEESASVVSVIGNGSEVFVQQVVQTDATNNLRTEQWFLVAPTVGSMSIEITLSQDAYISSGAESLQGVDQSDPIGTTSDDSGTSTTPSTTNVTESDNSIIFDSLGTAILPILHTQGSNQALNWTEVSDPTTRQGSSSYQSAGTAPDNVVMSWTLTQNTDWVITSLEIKGIDNGSIVNTDEKVKVSSTDTTSSYLEDKITVAAGSGLSITKLNSGGNEQLQLDLSLSGGGGGGTGGDGSFVGTAGEDIDEGDIVVIGDSSVESTFEELGSGTSTIYAVTSTGDSDNGKYFGSTFTLDTNDAPLNTSSIDILVERTGGSSGGTNFGEYTLSIYNVDGSNLPTGSPIATGTLTVNTWNDFDGSDQVLNIPISSVSLVPGNTYAFSMRYFTTDNDSFEFKGGTADATEVEQFESTDGTTWSARVSGTLYMKLYGTPDNGEVFKQRSTLQDGDFIGQSTQTVSQDANVRVDNLGVFSGYVGLTNATNYYHDVANPGGITSVQNNYFVGRSVNTTTIVNTNYQYGIQREIDIEETYTFLENGVVYGLLENGGGGSNDVTFTPVGGSATIVAQVGGVTQDSCSYSVPVSVGDQIEADALGGSVTAYFKPYL